MAVVLVTATIAVRGAHAAPVTARVSVASGGAQADWDCEHPAISANGRYIAFVSGAGNLAGNPGAVTDIYFQDRQTGTTSVVSLTSIGTRANGDSDSPAISADGRYIAFRSYATNLVPNDTNGAEDIFLRDTLLGTTERISVGLGGAQGDGPSDAPCISLDGRFVAFSSAATTLAGGDTNHARDIFLRDLSKGQTVRASRAFDGAQTDGDSVEPSLSADGRYVAFSSTATNIALSDVNAASDVFVVDRLTLQAARISVASTGLPADADSDQPRISPDGRIVAFRSWGANLVPLDLNGTADVFTHDRITHQTERVSVSSDSVPGNAPSETPALSADGRYIAFTSRATNLVAADTNGWADVFVRDRLLGRTERLSLASGGAPADYWNAAPAITPDGVYVAFASYATNLVTGDTNAVSDIYVRGPMAAVVTVADAGRALGIAGGMQYGAWLDLLRLDVQASAVSPQTIDLSDAARLARVAVGLDS